MPDFPRLCERDRLAMLAPPEGLLRAVLDTDTYNEVDDQFALAYAMLAPERLTLEAVYAAPFQNYRSTGPGDGMAKSYDEILRVLDRLGKTPAGGVHRGAERFLPDGETPVPSPAAADLVRRARDGEPPLYVCAIGAPTNVASALISAPDIVERIVVVWLGGQPQTWHTANEFNLGQDLAASQTLFDSGVPLVHIPCKNVAEHLRTTIAELQQHLAGRGSLADYLCEIVAGYAQDPYAWSKVIWDISTIAWLIEPAWVPTVLTHSPLLTTQITYSHDARRHLIREAVDCRRDAIFGDLFRRLGN